MVTWDVHIDISKDTVKGKNGVYRSGSKYYYKGSCGCTITLKKEEEPSVKVDSNRNENEKEPLYNYKQYYHTIPDNNAWWSVYYQLKRVEYNGALQTGLETKGKLKYYRKVSVIYWLNDKANIFPLIIGLGPGNVNYFKRENETTNEWKEASIIHPAYLSDYNKVLSELNKTFSDVVIINLNADKDKKYCGHPSKDEFKNPKDTSESCTQNENSLVTVTVSNGAENAVPSGFKGLKHSSSGNKMRVLCTYCDKSMIPFKESIVATEYECVNAYYTSESRSDKPLLLELQESGKGASKLYTLRNDGKWMLSKFSKHDLTQALDQQNCMINNIVVADLSKRDKYCCGMTRHNKIQVLPNTHNLPAGYTSYMHLPTSVTLSVYRFKSGSNTHTFSNISGRITGMYVYFCKSDDQNKPLLLYVNKRSTGGTWFKRTSVGGNNTWVDTGSNSLKNHTPSSHNIKQPIKEELHKICKELRIKCQHANSTTPTTSISSPGSGSGGGSGSSASSDPGVANEAGEDGPKPDEQSSASAPPSPGAGSSPPGSTETPTPPPATEPSNGGFLQPIVNFFQSNAEQIGGALGLAAVGSAIGVTMWKWPNILSFLITRL